ncbi:MAG: hypothetical protein F6K26_47120 [Moorea sp. SIO2I5]|nr:hypothetical protein [Moorena sp. SIO2I5]
MSPREHQDSEVRKNSGQNQYISSIDSDVLACFEQDKQKSLRSRSVGKAESQLNFLAFSNHRINNLVILENAIF